MIAVQIKHGTVKVEETARPERRHGFALIRLLAAGICNTDLELQRGYYGFEGIPGHEFVGEVVEADTEALIGERVVGEINLPCHNCEWCRRGFGRHCPNRTVLGIVKHPGAFAEFLTLPERNLHILPPTVPTRHGVFIEPVAAACEILDQVSLPPGARVAVLGDGKLGLLVAQVLQVSGAQVHQFGRHPDKLRIAESAGVVGEVADKLPVAEYDWVVDATGSPEGLRQAVSLVRPLGTVVLKSTVHGNVAIDTAPVIVNEVTLIGSRCGRFEPAIALLDAAKIQIDSMISETHDLSGAAAAFGAAGTKGALKVLLLNG